VNSPELKSPSVEKPLRRKHAPQCESAFSQRTVMLMGQAEFHDVRVGGRRVLMRLTKEEGFGFAAT